MSGSKAAFGVRAHLTAVGGPVGVSYCAPEKDEKAMKLDTRLIKVGGTSCLQECGTEKTLSGFIHSLRRAEVGTMRILKGGDIKR